MSNQLDSKIAAVLKESDLGPEACWKHKQSGKWIVYHWACETIAAKRGIVFDLPQIVVADPANKIATILVKGTLDKLTEWSFGEAAPYNTQQAYPFSMAEKRGKDRVILKLIGLHGLAYSEEEADDFKESKAAPEHGQLHGPLAMMKLKDAVRSLVHDLEGISDLDSLTGFLNDNQAVIDQCMRDLPGWWHTKNESDVVGLQDRISNRRQDLKVTEQEREHNYA